MSTPVHIIGAGWAGLAAAVSLTHRGKKVIVHEAAKQVGGRARSVQYHQYTVDNGQHLLIGAYSETLRLLKMVGQCPYAKFKRIPLFLSVRDKHGHSVELKAPRLPAPLHLLYALLSASGLSLRDRLAAVRFGLQLKKYHYQLAQDIPVAELFRQTRQTDTLIRQLWEPLCLSTLNTPIEQASANVFMRVFRDAFTRHYHDADLMLPITDLSNTFPDAAVNYIHSKGGEVRLQSRLEKLHIKNNRIEQLVMRHNNHQHEITANTVILAMAPQHLQKLLATVPQLQALQQQLQPVTYQPIVTVYLQYPAEIQMNKLMQGLSDSISQWVFDRGQLCKQPGLFSVVISADGKHMQMNDQQLIARVQKEIAQLFTKPPTLQDAFVIREKRATFSCDIGSNTLRPDNKTTVDGILLAGDYTATGYPATLEGAVRSALRAADFID